MAYNNGFPVTYPQYYPPQLQMQPQPIPQPMPQPQLQNQMQNPVPQPQQNNRVWVQGEAGAKSYLVAPNTSVDLWDSEAQTIYIKSADQGGMPTIKILDYTIRDQQQSQVNISPEPVKDYVTHEELEEFEDRMIQKLNDIKDKAGKDHEHKSNANNRNVTSNKV